MASARPKLDTTPAARTVVLEAVVRLMADLLERMNLLPRTTGLTAQIANNYAPLKEYLPHHSELSVTSHVRCA
nr:unnamed protein product [Digitaria exilis]